MLGEKLKSHWALPALVASTTLLLSACSAPETEAAPTVSVAPAATPKPTPSPIPTRKENERGELIKDIGETAGMSDTPEGPRTLNFKVTSMKLVKCDAPYATQPNGYALGINLEIETTADFEGPLVLNGTESGIDFGPYYWTGYASNGTRMNKIDGIQHNCLADETKVLPNWVGPGEKLNGMVILDVSTKKGEVAFDPANNGGWVWKYPSK
ncbi:hypothetical protein ACWF5H_12675 [Arthrobacter sp. NPDC055138]